MKITKKERIELIIIGLALVILIVYLANLFIKSKEAKSPGSDLSRIASKGREPYSVSKKAAAETKRKDLTWGRDPFMLGDKGEKGERPEQLVLDGIIWDKTNQYAIINNEVVKAGDIVNGNTVIEIKKDSVLLDNGTERVTLQMWE